MKRETFIKTVVCAAFIGFIFCFGASMARAQTTAFTYQGKLTDGAMVANGTYDLGFALYDAETGGTQIGTALTRPVVNVSNGIFTVQLDFGANAFAADANRFLQIAVKKTSETTFITLTPRQPLTSSLYAIRTLSATAADALSANCVGCVTNAQINAVDGAKVSGTVANAATANTATSAANATNANNSANLGSVAASSYLLKTGDGSQLTNLPVRLLPWETITAATQAQANRGYVAASDEAQIVVTLPTAPAVGDVVRVTGAGAAGWRIAQNDDQSIGGATLNSLPDVWTARQNGRFWRAVASSADGTKLIAVAGGDRIYTSTDSGATWTARTNQGQWSSAASSADGTKLVAAVSGGQIYTSNDSGATWTARESSRQWVSVASSADGTRLVAAVFGGQIYTSNDSGAMWSAVQNNRDWQSVASSADGRKLVAVVRGGQIYTSTTQGGIWTTRESDRFWWSAASSADGTKLIAVAGGDRIYTSTDSGATWTARESGREWYSAASSADGTKLIAVVSGGQIYTSNDTGVTWTARESNRAWSAAASSADGTKLVAVVEFGRIYTAAPGTSSGTTGYLTGGQNSTIELQFVGGGRFIVLNSQGTISNF